MTPNNFPSQTIGWIAIAVGALTFIGLVFLVLLFTVGQPFGTLNDAFIAIAAILGGVLAWMLYPVHHTQSPSLSLLALVAAFLGALVVTVGAAIVISGVKGWYLAGLYMMTGNGLIGLWLLALNYSSRHSFAWPHGLVLLGLVAGAVMVVGFLTIPGILNGIDAWDSAPWIVNIGQAGALGWMVLYPIWCVRLGRILLRT